GNPLLVWIQDKSSRGSIDPGVSGGGDEINRQFATVTSNGNNPDDGPACFYLASNQTYFSEDATTVGGSGRNQDAFSSLSTNVNDPMTGNSTPANPIDRIRTLTTLLASPSYYVIDQGTTLEDATYDEIYAARP